MLILAVDPGPKTSGFVMYDATGREVLEHRSDSSRTVLLDAINATPYSVLVVESVSFYGQRIGREVFETCKLIGAIELEHERSYPETLPNHSVVLLTRPEVIRHFCGVRNAPKGQVNAALYDRFGGSRQAAVGTKKNKGPLHGVHGHALDALCAAVAFSEGARPKGEEPATVGDALAELKAEIVEVEQQEGKR